MNQSDLLNYFDKVTSEMRATMVKKNSDYTGGNTDPFANFTAVEHIDFGVGTEQGLMVRMTDKIKRIASFVKQGTLQVKDESVTDTLLDLANYCILFSAYLRSKADNKNLLKCVGGRDSHMMENFRCVLCGLDDKGARAKQQGDVLPKQVLPEDSNQNYGLDDRQPI